MNSSFVPDPSKLNPKFEGYKLSPLSELANVIRLPLDDIQVDKPASDQRLGFRDLQARIRHSHLIYGHPLDDNRGTAFCIDGEFNLHMFVFDKLTKQTNVYSITQLIRPLGSIPAYTEPDRSLPVEPQLPSAATVSKELLLTSNGVGDIELIGLEEKNGCMVGASLATVCYLGAGDEGISPVPCVILKARLVKGRIVFVAYSRTASKKTEFNIVTLELEIPSAETKRLTDGLFALELKTLHIQTGPEVPVYCAITRYGRCIFGSEARYTRKKLTDEDEDEEEEESTTPMEDVQESSEPSNSNKPVYTWSQDGSDIVVQFSLPPTTSKTDVSCKFLVDHLSLLVQDTTISFPYRKLWSTVKPDECVWTLQEGTLTLNMTKVDENTRWPHLFDDDDGVLETLNSQVAAEINRRLDKFTTDNENLSFAQAAQHPAATDMDEDIDEAGEPVLFCVYDRNGKVEGEFSTGSYRWICSSYDIVHKLPSVCLQMDVDGLVFVFTEDSEGKISIQHQATFDAFAFVQASKRDARFVHHDPHFHFTSIIESSRNAYLYYHHDDKRIQEAQTLIDLTQGHDTDIIGAQLVLENMLAILTESQLIVVGL